MEIRKEPFLFPPKINYPSYRFYFSDIWVIQSSKLKTWRLLSFSSFILRLSNEISLNRAPRKQMILSYLFLYFLLYVVFEALHYIFNNERINEWCVCKNCVNSVGCHCNFLNYYFRYYKRLNKLMTKKSLFDLATRKSLATLDRFPEATKTKLIAMMSPIRLSGNRWDRVWGKRCLLRINICERNKSRQDRAEKEVERERDASVTKIQPTRLGPLE